jgi:hypothetical protein
MQKGAAYWMDLQHFDDEDPIFLSQVQRGITNFVKILTGKDIPVEYATSGDSMTDGETVYIASNLKEDTIDYTVGLALHEASHVLLTDFEYLNKNKGTVLKRTHKVPEEDHDNVFTLINFIEDKRIDDYVYKTAPGYQYYYEELYRKSFYNEIVDENLQKDIFVTPTWDAYFFRIINIFNRNSDLDKLPGLKEVLDLIDIKHINRLKSTQDSVEIAVGIYNIIKPYLQDEEQEEGGDQQLTNQEYRTREHVDRQKNFIDSKYRKKRVHKKVKEQVNKLTHSNTKIESSEVKEGVKINTITTDQWEEYFTSHFDHNREAVNSGIAMGKKLLKRLQSRNSVKTEVFDNLKKGKLNSKKIYSAVYNEDIFYRVEKEDFKHTFLHISLDLSGSMRGPKLAQTIKVAVAIAYAACHMKNFDVEISLRGTFTSSKATEHPILAYAFNSKKNSYKDLRKLSYLSTSGMTPEGICLDQVRKSLPEVNYFTEVYLLNISDGLPNINDIRYNFSTAINHTKKVVNQCVKNNIGVLSYYVEDTWDKRKDSKDSFKTMYGKSAKFIDVDNVQAISKTINNLLLDNTIKVS